MEEFDLVKWLPLIIWEGIWKGIALWKTAKNNQLKWYVAIFVLNTVGVLPIVYLFLFDPKRKNKKQD